jgi:hypothetical protein
LPFLRPPFSLFHGNADNSHRVLAYKGRARVIALKLATDTSFRIRRRKPYLLTISAFIIPETDMLPLSDMHIHIIYTYSYSHIIVLSLYDEELLQFIHCFHIFSVGARVFSSPQRPDQLWGPPSVLSLGYRERSGRGVKLTTYFTLEKTLGFHNWTNRQKDLYLGPMPKERRICWN